MKKAGVLTHLLFIFIKGSLIEGAVSYAD